MVILTQHFEFSGNGLPPLTLVSDSWRALVDVFVLSTLPYFFLVFFAEYIHPLLKFEKENILKAKQFGPKHLSKLVTKTNLAKYWSSSPLAVVHLQGTGCISNL